MPTLAAEPPHVASTGKMDTIDTRKLTENGENRPKTAVDKLMSIRQLGNGQQAGPREGNRPLPQQTEENRVVMEAETGHQCEEFDVSDVALMQELSAQGLQHNRTVTGKLADEEYHYYRVCVAKHDHEHEITIDVVALGGACKRKLCLDFAA